MRVDVDIYQGHGLVVIGEQCGDGRGMIAMHISSNERK